MTLYRLVFTLTQRGETTRVVVSGLTPYATTLYAAFTVIKIKKFNRSVKRIFSPPLPVYSSKQVAQNFSNDNMHLCTHFQLWVEISGLNNHFASFS